MNSTHQDEFTKLTVSSSRTHGVAERGLIVDEDDHEECVDIDKCSEHGLINFRPGKPHILTVNKRSFGGTRLRGSRDIKE